MPFQVDSYGLDDKGERRFLGIDEEFEGKEDNPRTGRATRPHHRRCDSMNAGDLKSVNTDGLYPCFGHSFSGIMKRA